MRDRPARRVTSIDERWMLSRTARRPRGADEHARCPPRRCGPRSRAAPVRARNPGSTTTGPTAKVPQSPPGPSQARQAGGGIVPICWRRPGRCPFRRRYERSGGSGSAGRGGQSTDSVALRWVRIGSIRPRIGDLVVLILPSEDPPPCVSSFVCRCLQRYDPQQQTRIVSPHTGPPSCPSHSASQSPRSDPKCIILSMTHGGLHRSVSRVFIALPHGSGTFSGMEIRSESSSGRNSLRTRRSVPILTAKESAPLKPPAACMELDRSTAASDALPKVPAAMSGGCVGCLVDGTEHTCGYTKLPLFLHRGLPRRRF